MQRRTFLRRMGAGTAGLAGLPYVSGSWFSGKKSRSVDLVIAGGGAGGICAAVQAARLGAEVVVLEPSPWVGGMLTAAGVSALDGNKHGAGGGLVHAFRQRLADHYGSMEALHTGWVSLYCYEPSVGHRILQDWVDDLDALTVVHGVEPITYERVAERRRRIGVAPVPDAYGPPSCREPTRTLTCSVFIDATEYGDGLKLAGIPYRLGRESRDRLGEPAAPEEADEEIQDLTYVATLARRPGAEPRAVTPQDRAYWDLFRCSTQEDCADPDEERLGHTVHDWESFISYAALPGEKYLLNWPHRSNDYAVPVDFFEDRYFRRRHLMAAKQHTLQYVKYMQTELGHPEWQVATDEYPTADDLPPLPYMRESRRMANGAPMVQQDVVPEGDDPRAPVIGDSIAVGDYFLDHHHAKKHLPPGCRLTEDYPDNAPFQVPPSVFLPHTGDPCFLAAEKNVAVSHVVNGCTRLQPVVMLMGQAVGAMAAFAARAGRAPADVDTARVQATLLDAGCQLYAMYDVPTGHDLFRPVQELALEGVLRADDPTELKPAQPMPAGRAKTWARRAGLASAVAAAGDGPLAPAALRSPLAGRLPEDGGDPVSRAAFVRALHDAATAG